MAPSLQVASASASDERPLCRRPLCRRPSPQSGAAPPCATQGTPSARPARVLQVHIAALSGEGCRLSLDPDTTLQELKHAVEQHLAVPALEQRLLLGSHELRDPAASLGGLAGQDAGASEGHLFLQLLRRPAEQAALLRQLEAIPGHEVPEWLELSPEVLREDREVILAAVRRSGLALKCAAPECQGDKEVVLEAVCQNGNALEFASAELQADRDIVLAAVARRGDALRLAAPALRADRDVVLAAVSRRGEALRHADPALRADRQIVLAAVRQSAEAFEYAAPGLKRDREIVLIIGL